MFELAIQALEDKLEEQHITILHAANRVEERTRQAIEAKERHHAYVEVREQLEREIAHLRSLDQCESVPAKDK